MDGITFKQWTDFPPAGDSTFTGVLTQRCLEKEDWDPTSKQEDEVWNEEGTWTNKQVEGTVHTETFAKLSNTGKLKRISPFFKSFGILSYLYCRHFYPML